ncbi:MAG: TIGR01244 family phosphatase, partial [Burkholderiales bacterium]|nr:TIGR01244 family phosphatase [Burkholderiales bacterium]
MELHTLVPELSVAAQIAASDLAALHAAGYRAIICNRPDGEGADQPNYSEIAQAALGLGIATRYLPAVSGQVTDAEGAAFGALMRELPRPVLAYCRTGIRSTTMWALSEAATRPLP